ncbi:DUF2157 domain-containing protein [Gracilibacillus marinus]|uniref:DUF2157 domain-containing protein n=1 Tax=Gracilibacillus marinus TaxID=630535 RepID=A0ABV8VTF8_9BACI
MNRQEIMKEATEWLKEEIITEDQFHKIVNRYELKDRSYLLFLFASLFIGLVFLTYVASNLHVIPHLVNLTIILLFMIGYYVIGNYFYRYKSTKVGLSLLIIGLFIFGAGIFLLGQMYHYSYLHAVPFLIWSIAAFSLFVIYKHPALFVFTVTVITIGQIYNGMNYQSFYWLLAIFFVAACLHYVYHEPNRLYSLLFGWSYLVQGIVFVIVSDHDYHIYLHIFLLLFIAGAILNKDRIKEEFQYVALLAGFVFTCFETIFLRYARIELDWIYFFLWIPLFLIAVGIQITRRHYMYLPSLLLFIPIAYAGEYSDYLSMLALFIVSLSWLMLGYRVEDMKKITLGSVTFLISTFIAYFHLAWAFLDKSIFFFIGGILLFLLGYFLERKRRELKHSEVADK